LASWLGDVVLDSGRGDFDPPVEVEGAAQLRPAPIPVQVRARHAEHVGGFSEWDKPIRFGLADRLAVFCEQTGKQHGDNRQDLSEQGASVLGTERHNPLGASE